MRELRYCLCICCREGVNTSIYTAFEPGPLGIPAKKSLKLGYFNSVSRKKSLISLTLTYNMLLSQHTEN